MPRGARTFLALLLTLATASVAVRLTHTRRWVPGGPPLTMNGLRLGMTLSDVKAAGWELFGNEKVEFGRYSTWCRTESNLVAMELSFDEQGHLAALFGVGPLCQGDRLLIDDWCEEDAVFDSTFGRLTPPQARRVQIFPEAGVAVATTCDGWLPCLLHKLNGGLRIHIFLGSVPGSYLGFRGDKLRPIADLVPTRRTRTSPLPVDRAGRPLRAQDWIPRGWCRVFQGDRLLLQGPAPFPQMLGSSKQDVLDTLGPPLAASGRVYSWDLEISKGDSWWDGTFDYLEVRFDGNDRVALLTPLDEPPTSYKLR